MLAEQDGFAISNEPARLDLDAIERLLRDSYWASARPRTVIELSIHHSRSFGVYEKRSGHQVGFARVVTDFATFAWLCDVIIDKAYRGRGLGKWLMACVLADPDLAAVRLWILATSDADGFYEQYGFKPLGPRARWMERVATAR